MAMIFNRQILILCNLLGATLILFSLQACSDEGDIVDPVDPCNLSIVAAAELDSLPSILQLYYPIYPYRARQEGWEGSATASIVVNADSSICSVSITESSGRDDVDSSVLQAMNRTIFAAGILDGESVRSVYPQTITFVLRGVPQPGHAVGNGELRHYIYVTNNTK